MNMSGHEADHVLSKVRRVTGLVCLAVFFVLKKHSS
jgi:hypothetical protein